MGRRRGRRGSPIGLFVGAGAALLMIGRCTAPRPPVAARTPAPSRPVATATPTADARLARELAEDARVRQERERPRPAASPTKTQEQELSDAEFWARKERRDLEEARQWQEHQSLVQQVHAASAYDGVNAPPAPRPRTRPLPNQYTGGGYPVSYGSAGGGSRRGRDGSSYSVGVRGYMRNGKYVAPHSRRPPKRR